MSRGDATRLPEGRHFALTWTIPETYGGQTSSMLHRSRAFVRIGGTPVALLTFDPRPDYPALERRLRERGELIDGMRVINLWDWLRKHDVPRRNAPLGSPERVFTPLAPDPEHRSEHRGRVEVIRTRFAADLQTVLQIDHYRADGSLLLSDRRDACERGVLGGRSLVLCDRAGEPVRSWGTSWSLYAWWLDRLTEGADAFLLVDSKPMAKFLLTYRRPGRATMHIVHGSHLYGMAGPWGKLRESREQVMRNLDAFDAVALLTRRHKRDVWLRWGPKRHLSVLPNSRTLPDLPAGFQARAPERGMMLATLAPLKRADHAIRALGLARKWSGADVRLDIYGDGPQRERLGRIIQETGVSDAVRLRGYRPDARERLTEASFLLLTSTSEGFGLVLVEAMAAGCIPIAYDIRYGPSEIITHGRTGFLVRSGDLNGLARTIARLQRMPADRVERMRTAARRAAEHFSDEAVVPLWSRELTAALERNRATIPPQE
ncbi:glycosyltransferase [Lysobacter korlensis]|uniref:Glycosyltransferase n=1 Tax=Lysobacter korlensis TaxID=553636 RepID=A0ABV6RW78_9GAMM